MNDVMSEAPTIKSMPLWQAVFFFGIPAIVIAFDFHWFVLPLINRRGFLEISVVAFIVPFVLLFIASLVAFRKESNPPTWAALKERFRLCRMGHGDWLWTAGLLVFSLLSYGYLSAIVQKLIASGWLTVPNAVYGLLGLHGQQFGGQAKDNWIFLLGTFIQLFINVAGEELWWRGYILPRQELTHGKHTWVIHGGLWCLFHLFKWWEYPALLPLCLGIAYVSQRRRNTWPAIIVHFLFNSVGMINIVPLVLGSG